MENKEEMDYNIVIRGTIGSWWDCPSVDYVRYILNQNKNKEVHIGFSSYGGYVKDGLELNQLFKDHGNVHAHAFGMNASISTIAMLGCKTIDIVKGSFFLIHNTSTVIATYSQKNKDELDTYIKNLTKQKEDLATFDDVLAQMYADKTGKTKDECAAQMNKANWLTAQEAVDFGLVDEIREDDETEKATSKITDEYLNNYQNIKETGIPPLPQQQQQPSLSAIVDVKGNPTPGFLEKAFQGLKTLFGKTNAKVPEPSMSKPTLTALETLFGAGALNFDDKGQVVLTEDQAKTLNEKLAKPKDEKNDGEDAIKPAEPASPATEGAKDELAKAQDELQIAKDELAKAKNTIAEKEQQVKNLQGAPADETKENPANGGENFTAKDLYDCIKDI